MLEVLFVLTPVAVRHYAAVKVDDRAVLRTLPHVYKFGSTVVALGNRLVVDGVKVLCVNSDPLIRFGDRELPDEFA